MSDEVDRLNSSTTKNRKSKEAHVSPSEYIYGEDCRTKSGSEKGDTLGHLLLPPAPDVPDVSSKLVAKNVVRMHRYLMLLFLT